MKTTMLLWLSGLLFIAGCKHPQTSGSIPPASAEGAPCPVLGRVVVGVVLRGASASFCEDRVVGPNVNMTRGTEGKWTGWIGQSALTLASVGNKLESSTLQLTISETPEGLLVDGIWVGDFVQIRVSPADVYVRTPPFPSSIWVRRAPDGSYGDGVLAQAIRFEGAATELHPPEPQFTIAMLGAF